MGSRNRAALLSFVNVHAAETYFSRLIQINGSGSYLDYKIFFTVVHSRRLGGVYAMARYCVGSLLFEFNDKLNLQVFIFQPHTLSLP